MFVDSLDQLVAYDAILPGLARAAAFVRQANELSDGRHEIDGDRLYAMTATYETEPADERQFEAHRRYADLQVLLAGRERMDVAPAAGLADVEPYDPAKDLVFLNTPEMYHSLRLGPGSGAIFLPGDAHRPNCQLAEPGEARKVVVKILLGG